MYYLLEDNRIVDEDKKAKEGQIIYVVDDSLHCSSLYEKKWLGKIKKQSKNVFDLLENGDLVKFRYVKIIELCDFQDNANNFVNYLKDCLPEKILAIYKPDAKGNYIKVWEVKENVD